MRSSIPVNISLVTSTSFQRNMQGDREEAMFQLDGSLSIPCDLGMSPLMERVLPDWDILKAGSVAITPQQR